MRGGVPREACPDVSVVCASWLVLFRGVVASKRKGQLLQRGAVPLRRLPGRRVEVNIKSRDLVVSYDDEIHTGVLGCFAIRPRAPRQASRLVQNLRHAVRRIDIVGMRRSEIAGELVQCIVTGESTGWYAQHTVFSVKFLNRCPSARRITFTKNFRKIAV